MPGDTKPKDPKSGDQSSSGSGAGGGSSGSIQTSGELNYVYGPDGKLLMTFPNRDPPKTPKPEQPRTGPGTD